MRKRRTRVQYYNDLRRYSKSKEGMVPRYLEALPRIESNEIAASYLKNVHSHSYSLNRELSIVLSTLLKIGSSEKSKEKVEEEKVKKKEKRIVLTKKTRERLCFPINHHDPFYIAPPRLFLPFPKQQEQPKKYERRRKGRKKKKKRGKRSRRVRPVTRFDKRTSSFRSLVKFVSQKRNKVDCMIRKKHSIARLNREKMRKRTLDAERKFKLGTFIVFTSRFQVLINEVRKQKLERRAKKLEINFSRVTDLIARHCLNRRTDRWKHAFCTFRKHFVFFKLYLNTLRKKKKVSQIVEFLSNIKSQNLMLLVMRSFTNRIRQIQQLFRARLQVEEDRVMLNFLNWSRMESKLLLNDFPIDLFQTIETTYRPKEKKDENDEQQTTATKKFLCIFLKKNPEKEKRRRRTISTKIRERNLEFVVTSKPGSFTYIIPSPEMKIKVLKEIISRDMNRLRIYQEEERKIWSTKERVLLEDKKIKELCFRGFKTQKKQEMEVRNEIIMEDDSTYMDICINENKVHLDCTFERTQEIIVEYFGKKLYNALFVLTKSKIKNIGIKRLTDRLNY